MGVGNDDGFWLGTRVDIGYGRSLNDEFASFARMIPLEVDGVLVLTHSADL